MLGWIERRPERVLVLLAAYFVINCAVRLALPSSLELDEAQQSLVTQWLALGYDTQPPFYNWIQFGLNSIIGNSVLSLSLLKNAILFSTYAVAFLTARRLLSSSHLAAVAALGLLTLPQIAWYSQVDLTHSVALNFAAALFVYGLLGALQDGRTRFFVIIGIAIGIGLISKYNFAVLVLAAIVGILASPVYRAKLLDRRILLAGLVAALIVLPHALWLIGNIDAATQGTVSKLTKNSTSAYGIQVLAGLGSIAVAFAGFIATTFVLFALAFGRSFRRALPVSTPQTRLFEIMALMLIVVLIAMVLFGGASSFRDRWLSPVLLALPLYLCLKLDAAGLDGCTALRRFLPIALVIMALVPSVLLFRVTGAALTGHYEKLNVPYSTFAARLVAEEGNAPSLVVAADGHLAGNMRMQLPQASVAAQSYGVTPPYDWTATAPVLIVWRATGDLQSTFPSELADWVRTELGAAPPMPRTMDVPYHFGGAQDTYRFGYAWIRKP